MLICIICLFSKFLRSQVCFCPALQQYSLLAALVAVSSYWIYQTTWDNPWILQIDVVTYLSKLFGWFSINPFAIDRALMTLLRRFEVTRRTHCKSSCRKCSIHLTYVCKAATVDFRVFQASDLVCESEWSVSKKQTLPSYVLQLASLVTMTSKTMTRSRLFLSALLIF